MGSLAVVTQDGLPLQLQLVLELTVKLWFPPLAPKLRVGELSDSVAAAPLWVMRWVFVTMLAPEVVVKVSVTARVLIEVLGCTV